MPNEIFSLNILATLVAMEVGDELRLDYDDACVEVVRSTACRLKPRSYSVNKTEEGILITRKS